MSLRLPPKFFLNRLHLVYLWNLKRISKFIMHNNRKVPMCSINLTKKIIAIDTQQKLGMSRFISQN